MNRSYALIRTFIILFVLLAVMIPSVLSEVSLDESVIEPSNSVIAASDSSAPADLDTGPADQPRRQAGTYECALGFTPAVFLDDGSPPSDYPLTFVEPTNDIFADSGFFDVSYPTPKGEGGEVTVGDTLVLYAAIRNVSDTSCDTPVDLNWTGFEVTVAGETFDATDSITWSDDTPGVLSVGETAIVQFPYEVQANDITLIFNTEATYECTNPGDAAFCLSGVVQEPSVYPNYRARTLPEDGNQTYQQIYGSLNPFVSVVGPRATVSVTANGSAEPITVVPFQAVTYEITLTGVGDGSDAIQSIDSLEALGDVIPECDTSRWGQPGQEPNGVGWFINDVEVDTRDLSADPLGPSDIAVCRFARTMDPIIINDIANDTFTLRGDIQISNLPNISGQFGNIQIEAPAVLIAEADITVVKEVLSPADDQPVRVGDNIQYGVTVINTGNTNLSDLRFVDSLVGIVAPPFNTLDIGEEEFFSYNYEVSEDAPNPLLNTITVTAQVTGAPPGFTVQDSAAATLDLAQDELSATLSVVSVDGAPFNPDNRATYPRPGSTVVFAVEYCNQSDGFLSDLRYVNNTPAFVNLPRPTFVDSALNNGQFDVGCAAPDTARFTYDVPQVTDGGFTDPILNRIRVRAITAGGQFVFAESEFALNVLSDTIEIDAVRYSNITGEELGDSDAALRGEVVYYHLDLENFSGTDVCDVVVRHYVQSSTGQLLPGDPFIIADNYIDWGSGTPGRLNADDGGPGGPDSATSRNIDSPTISFVIQGDTPDPLYRIFEVEATQDCSGSPLTEPYLDRAAVFTDISNVQINNLVEVYSVDQSGQIISDALDFGLRLAGQRYRFRYSATNVGAGFTITSLRYCWITDISCAFESDFPNDAENFFSVDDNEFQPFQTRTDLSGVLEIEGDEQTPIQILVTLQGREGDNNLTIRVLQSFLLLTEDLPGEIVDGPEQLVRGDGPVPYDYTFVNETGGALQNVKIYNILETGDAFIPGLYEPITAFPGFDPDTYYEVCDVPGLVLADGAIQGTCNLTFRSFFPQGGFQLQILLIGERTVDQTPVIGAATADITELPHLQALKETSETTVVSQPAFFSIELTNNSEYQPVEFSVAEGLEEILEPPVQGADLPDLTDFSGFVEPRGDGSPVRTLRPGGTAVVTFEVLAPEDVSILTNTVNFVGESLPNPDAPLGESDFGRSITATAFASTEYTCPVAQFGTFVDEADAPFFLPSNADTDGVFTTGEGRWVYIATVNIGSNPIQVTGLRDEVYFRENGRSVDLNTDVTWPDPDNIGVLQPGEFAGYYTPIYLRPADLVTEQGQPALSGAVTFSWLATVSLGGNPGLGIEIPEGCQEFDTLWFFVYPHPLDTAKFRIDGGGLIFPGDIIQYDIDLLNINERVPFVIESVTDVLTSPSRELTFNATMDFPSSGTQGTTGRVQPFPLDGSPIDVATASMVNNGIQDIYVANTLDLGQAVDNTATVTFYIPSTATVPDHWDESVYGAGVPMFGAANLSVAIGSPLRLRLEPTVEEVPVGSRFDIAVLVNNISGDFTIDEIIIDSPDTQFLQGLVASGYPNVSGLFLDTSSSAGYNIGEPYYQIPTDYVGDTYEICATATGTLNDLARSEVTAEACTEIRVLPADLVITKTAHPDAACTGILPDSNNDGKPEVEILNPVYFLISIENTGVQNFYSQFNLTDELSTGETIDIQTRFEQAILDIYGPDIIYFEPGMRVEFCVPYDVPSIAIDLPTLDNTITADVFVTAGPVPEGSTLTVATTLEMEAVDANIQITKTAPQNVAFPGDEVTYTITILNRNTDNYVLVLNDVYDTLLSGQLPGNPSYVDTCLEDWDLGEDLGLSPSCDPSVTSIPFDDPRWEWPLSDLGGDPIPGVIPAGEVATFTYTYEVQPADPDPLLNTVGTSSLIFNNGTDPINNPTGEWTLILEADMITPLVPRDTAELAIAVTDSQLLVRKSATVSSALVGSQVTYSITVTNIGDTPVSNVQVIDCYPLSAEPCDFEFDPFTPEFGGTDLTSSLAPSINQTRLDPFESVFVSNYVLTMPTVSDLVNDPGLDPYINTAFATGSVDIGGGELQGLPPSSDSAVVDLFVPGLSVIKRTQDGIGSAVVGDTVTYEVEIRNTGDVDVRIDSAQDVVPGDMDGMPINITEFNVGTCDDAQATQTYTVGSGDPLAPYDPDAPEPVFLCKRIDIVVTLPQGGGSEFINTVRVSATTIPGGEVINDGASAVVDVRVFGVIVEKQAIELGSSTPINVVQDGEQFRYRITVQNGGVVALQEVRLSDPLLDPDASVVIRGDVDGFGPGDANNNDLLDPGESFTYDYVYTADYGRDTRNGELDALVNTVTVVAVDANGELTPGRTASDSIVIEPVELSVQKLACREIDGNPPTFPDCVVPVPFAQPGDTVWYQVTVTNPSNRQITGVTINDTLAGLLTGDPGDWTGGVVGTLPACVGDPCPTAVITYAGTPIPGGTDAVNNTVVVDALAGETPIQTQDTATVAVVTGDLFVSVVERNGRTEAIAGTGLTFDVTVTNTSSGTTINNIELTLPLIDGTPRTIGTLVAGEAHPEVYTYTVQASDNTLDFEAFASGILEGTSLPVSDSDTWRVVRVVNGVSVTKSADRDYAAVGDPVIYTITVENTGTQTISNLNVQDSLIDLTGDPFPVTLTAGQSASRTYTYTITGGEGNPVVNTLTATGEFGVSPFSIETDWTVFIVGGPSGEILVTNEPTRPSVDVGEVASFNYSICNLSGVEMTNVALSDDDGALTLPGNTLQPDQCFFATRSVTATVDDVPEISRTVMGTGNVSGNDLEQSVTRTVEVVDPLTGGMEFTVTAIPSNYVMLAVPAETVTVNFSIRNNGDTSLTIQSFTDSRPWYSSFSPVNPVGQSIPPGGVLNFTGDALVGGGSGPIVVTDTTPDPITGTWTVVATDGVEVFEDSGSISIPVISQPGATLALSYESDPSPALPGDTITYTFTVQNIWSGLVTATLDVTADDCDSFTPDSSTIWTTGLDIPMGGSVEITATCVVPDPFTDPEIVLAAQVFDAASPSTPQDEADATTPIEQPAPALDVEVMGSEPAFLQVGSPAELIYRVSNTTQAGSITGIDLTLSPACLAEDREYFEDVDGETPTTFNGTLAAETTVYVFCSYTPTEDDLPELDVTVSATADGNLSDADTTTISILDIDFSVTLTGSLAQDGETTAEPGQTVDFTIVITNNGASTLELPTFTEDNSPIVSSFRNVGTGQTMVATLGDPQTIYTFMASGDPDCNFPLVTGETCTITEADFADTTTLRYAVTADSPTEIDVQVSVFLQEALTDTATPAATDTWTVNVTGGDASLSITNFAYSPQTGIESGESITFTATITNNGELPLTIPTQGVQFTLTQTSQTSGVFGDDGIYLTSGRQQGATCASGVMTLDRSGVTLSLPYPFVVNDSFTASYVFNYTGQTTCTGTLEARITVTSTYNDDEGTQTLIENATLTLNSSNVFSTGTDPDGNPLDPNALDPTVTKTVSPEEGAGPGDTVTFTVEVTNGSTSAMDITLFDAVASVFAIQSVSSSTGTPVTLEQEIGLQVTLAAGERVTVEIVTVLSDAVEVPSLYTNSACAASGSRTPICADVEIPIGAVGSGEGGSLPATGIGSTVQPPWLQQGLSGEAGFSGMLMLAVSLMLMMNITGVIRPRWIIIGAISLMAVVVVAGALLFGGGGDDSQEKKTNNEATAVVVDGNSTPQLPPTTVQEETAEGTPVPPAGPTNTFGPGTPTPLPGFPTLLPSPTPYAVEWSGRVRIDIPKLGFVRPIPVVPLPLVDNTWNVTSLGFNIGWLEETTWLEPDWGNTVLVAHVQLHVEQPGPFYYLFLLDEGDEIVIYEGNEVHRFLVYETTRVDYTAIEETWPTRDPILTLITCTNWDEARGVFSQRRIVRAIPVGETPPDTNGDAPAQAG